ncbi:MAG TPA: zinc ribbon domain-containing protein [Nocardioides sp.]|nr:zinc ribbon domain-containing protein [Nocardioides sp.]
MTTPTYCTSCGHELGVGRFCTNCGRPVPGRHPEAVPAPDVPPAPVTARPPAPPTAVVPPPVGALPPAPRYPLFAETGSADPQATVARPAAGAGTTSLPPVGPPTGAPHGLPAGAGRTTPRWIPWLVALVLLALIGGVGGYLLASGDDTGDRAGDRAGDQQTLDPSDPSGEGATEPDQPDSSGTGGPVADPDPADVVDLSAELTAEVPAVAPPSRDRADQPVLFDPENMWDGKPRTSWRMPGDGTGTTLVFDLGRDVVITEVGMINGYAKVDGPDNWYRGNRRIRAVQWEFDDGTRITQELGERQRIQTIDVGPVATRTVRVHLLEVTPPGQGPDGRDFTAISEIRFLGAPG